MELVSPIKNSFYNLVRYHLGTVLFGALLITLINVMKTLWKMLKRSCKVSCCGGCCCCCCCCLRFNWCSVIETLIKYLSKNAYIQTAMHGEPLLTSGKMAIDLLVANVSTAILINYIGDFVILAAQFCIISITIVFLILVQDNVFGYTSVYGFVIGIFVTVLLAHCFFSALKTTVDTVFLCYCEDCCMNNGVSRPYYMSRDMMLLMEDTKAFYVKK